MSTQLPAAQRRIPAAGRRSIQKVSCGEEACALRHHKAQILGVGYVSGVRAAGRIKSLEEECWCDVAAALCRRRTVDRPTDRKEAGEAVQVRWCDHVEVKLIQLGTRMERGGDVNEPVHDVTGGVSNDGNVDPQVLK